MKRFLLILPLLLSIAQPVTHICAQVGPDPSNLFHTATSGTLMGRYQGLRGWVVSLEERTCRYIPDDSAAVTTLPRPLAPDSVSHLYHFDPHGNIISIVVTSWGNGTDAGVQETVAYVYDHRARLSQTVLIDDGDTTTLLQFFYNDTTDCIRLVSCPQRCDGIWNIRYDYTPQGVCKRFFDDRKRTILEACYRDGCLVSMVDHDPYSGDPTQLQTVVRHDAGGNPLLLADALQPDNTALQTRCEYDPYGNILLMASEGDTLVNNYTLYDLTHNWLQREAIDNGRRSDLTRRTIRYATDSADFRDVYRLHDPFWTENNPTGFLEMHYPNGDYYLGDLLQGQPHGTGDLTLASGTTFSGSYEHGRYHGSGILRSPATSSLPAKEIHASWQHGHILTRHVEIAYADSSLYTGEFHPDDDSCRYQGQTLLLGGGSYQGEYALEHYDGQGTLRLADGTLLQGSWEHGKPHGDMLIVMPSLDRHHAHFSHGQRVGISTIEYINGDLYRGETDQQGIPNGMGSYTTATGKTRSGYFLDGRYRGPHRPAARPKKQ